MNYAKLQVQFLFPLLIRETRYIFSNINKKLIFCLERYIIL